jgi:protein TonB
MTVLMPLKVFEGAYATRARWPGFDRDKLISGLVTIGLHLLIAAAALTAVEVTRPHMMPELSVRIAPEQPKPMEEIKPPEHLTVPSIMTAPLPDITVQAATAPLTAVAPPADVPIVPSGQAMPQKAAGETRDAFLARLLAQLNRFKQYPRAARQAHIEGVVMLHFIMDAEGNVLTSEIATSSGRPVLDNEALALIQRAQPLPALPAGFPTPTLDAVVPIEFSLNG